MTYDRSYLYKVKLTSNDGEVFYVTYESFTDQYKLVNVNDPHDVVKLVGVHSENKIIELQNIIRDMCSKMDGLTYLEVDNKIYVDSDSSISFYEIDLDTTTLDTLKELITNMSEVDYS